MKTKNSLESFKDFFEQNRIPLRLACITRQGWPMVVSLWFLYEAEKLYCATQKTSKLVYHLQQNPRCAFEVAGDQPPYRGVRGQGDITLIPDLGPAMLQRLSERYLREADTPLSRTLLSRAENELAIEIRPIRIFAWDYTKRMRNSI